MQYIAWPDHGVPDSPKMFLLFTEHVREARKKTQAPIIVHCSAGIGRTGVLVLMESALCLIEAGEPVYPLDIVQMMRKQRAMMIQNAVSSAQGCFDSIIRIIWHLFWQYYLTVSFDIYFDSIIWHLCWPLLWQHYLTFILTVLFDIYFDSNIWYFFW